MVVVLSDERTRHDPSLLPAQAATVPARRGVHGPRQLMRALVADGSGVSLAEAPDPQVDASHALVEVKAVSLNRGEVRRLPARKPGTIPGWDVAGVLSDGTRVVGLADEGGWAELAAVPKDRLAALPDDVSFEAASTLPVAGLTAMRALEVGGPLLGRRVLDHRRRRRRRPLRDPARPSRGRARHRRRPQRRARRGPARARRRRADHRARARGRAVRPAARVGRRREPRRRAHARRARGHRRGLRRLLARAHHLRRLGLLRPRRVAALRPARVRRARPAPLGRARPHAARRRAGRRPARPADRPRDELART